MIYDIVNIINLILCAVGSYNLGVVISKNYKKTFVPPVAKGKTLKAMWAILGISSFAMGLVIHASVMSLYQDIYSAVFGIICCLLIYISSVMFLYLAKEEEIVISNATILNNT